MENSNTNQLNTINPVNEPLNQSELVKNDILKWFELDDDIIMLSEKLKLLKTNRDTLTKKIEGFMENNNIGDIHSQGQKLKYCVSQSTKSHTKKSLQTTLGHFFQNNETADKAYQFIMDNRETTKRVRLKRTTNKNTPTKQKIV